MAAILGASAADAHTSYLLPNLFKTEDAKVVTLQAAFTEDFSRPEVGIPSSDWSVTKPDGSKATFKRVEAFEQMTVLEADLADMGTYRFSTGERLGRTGQQLLIGDDWVPVEPGQAIPASARTRPSQTVTLADVYVSKGAPTMRAVEARSGRLELKPVTHPNTATMKDGFKLRVLLDGKPVANQVVNVSREGGSYETPKYDKIVRTDASGTLSLSFDKGGAYLMMTRLSADAPAGSQTAIRSYTTSLTLEVTN